MHAHVKHMRMMQFPSMTLRQPHSGFSTCKSCETDYTTANLNITPYTFISCSVKQPQMHFEAGCLSFMVGKACSLPTAVMLPLVVGEYEK